MLTPGEKRREFFKLSPILIWRETLYWEFDFFNFTKRVVEYEKNSLFGSIVPIKSYLNFVAGVH